MVHPAGLSEDLPDVFCHARQWHHPFCRYHCRCVENFINFVKPKIILTFAPPM